MNSIRDNFLNDLLLICVPDYEEHSEWDGIERNYFDVCKRCGKDEFAHNLLNPKFSTWEGFGKLITFCRQQEWWTDFYYNNLCVDYSDAEPDIFADKVYEYLMCEQNKHLSSIGFGIQEMTSPSGNILKMSIPKDAE